jgi:rod shape determining protein RodA
MLSKTDPLLKKNTSYNSLVLTLVFFILLIVGLANLYSASSGDDYFHNQMKHIFVGIFSFVLFAWCIPLRYVNFYANIFFVIITICLFIVLLFGHSAGGAQRWMSFGPIKFQPSEIAKLSMAGMVAKFFYNQKQVMSYSLKDLWPVFLASFGTFILIFKQPDLGTAGVCLIIAFVQLAFIRIPIGLPVILLSAIFSIIMGILGWNFFLKSYQKLRILNLLNPNMDPSGSGYNSLQSLVAIGSGHQFGKGFLQGTQTQLQFLPARHTDFIFSVFAEEHGFWGSTSVFLLFLAIAYLSLEIARNAKDTFGALLAIGIGALFFVEFTINVAMVLGIFPVVGMPLPFFSYGGTSLITLCLAVGLLVSIERDSRKMSKSRSKI